MNKNLHDEFIMRLKHERLKQNLYMVKIYKKKKKML